MTTKTWKVLEFELSVFLVYNLNKLVIPISATETQAEANKSKKNIINPEKTNI
jgi:hypothetical protein